LLKKLEKTLQENTLDKVDLPLFMVLAGKEKVVDNKAAKNFYEITEIKDKALIEIDDACHQLTQDKEYWPMLTKDIISWLNVHS
jgi:esterase/lipase